MLNFREIEKDDVAIIREYTQKCGIQSCDFTLCGIYLWGVYYKYEICVYKNTLFVKGVDESGRAAFALPIGEMERSESIKLVCDYCRLHKIEPRFSFVPRCALDSFVGGNSLKLEGWSDYIYDAESLKTLAGKKLHKKKNRFNKFEKSYKNHRFLRVDCENLCRLADFYQRFKQENPPDSDRLSAEEAIIERILDEFENLSLNCGMLEVDGEIVAFAIGERVGDTLYVHFEKALRSFDGAFEAVNCLFVREFANGARFVDREEDMNDLGLRQAKSAYNPMYFVDKYVVLIPEAENTNG
jgi:hypothetical protein